MVAGLRRSRSPEPAQSVQPTLSVPNANGPSVKLKSGDYTLDKNRGGRYRAGVRIWRVLGGGTTVVGLAGIPDDIRLWAMWLDYMGAWLDNWSVRASLALLGIALATYPQWLPNTRWYFRRIRSSQRLPEAWRILGARTSWFSLYTAACLLVGDEPDWPLPTERSREEYDALCAAIRAGKLDDDGMADESWAYNYGMHEAGDEVHQMELDRDTLRKYLRCSSRPIPLFLDERFDESGTLREDDPGGVAIG